MAFETLSNRLQEVATKSLAYCRTRYGGNGLHVEQGINDDIMWRPTFFLKPGRFRIIAVEVEDNLYPQSLKGAAHEISHFNFPISVFQACTLDAFQNDPRQANINLLKKHGFGIITVDDSGVVTIQHNCVPLAQHISPDLFERDIKDLSRSLKVSFHAAYDVYKTNETQGLQDAGQIVEAIVTCIASHAVKKGIFAQNIMTKPLASRIDDMYAHSLFNNYRATLGGARDFIQEYRNTASHPADTAKKAADKIRKCRTGFLDAIVICTKLKAMSHALGYPIKVHVT